MRKYLSSHLFLLLIISLPAAVRAQVTTEKCSEEEITLINEKVILARTGAQRILTEIESRSGEILHSSREIRDQIRSTKKVLVCAINRLQSPRYVCNGHNPGTHNAGWTLPFPGSKIKLTSIQYGGRISLEQTLLHEATHQCMTTDAAYFGDTHNTGEVPRSVGIIGWSRIADSYSYWMKYGFCIPTIDC